MITDESLLRTLVAADADNIANDDAGK